MNTTDPAQTPLGQIPPPGLAGHRVPVRSLVVAGFSTVVEWYDFTLYLYFATVLARTFYGDSKTSLVTALAGFAVAYLLRPFGALAFGHIGDRFGRRNMMLLSMALMSAAMLITGLLPTYDTIGPAAGWLMLFMRCVMAFSVGGEYTGVVAYLYEGADVRRRGLVASWASAASEIGGLLAVGLSALTVYLFNEQQLVSWGWRLPFLLGAALAGAVWIARSTMHESPDFERQEAEGTTPESPLRHTLANHRGGVARSFAISALGSITYYVGITYVPPFLVSTGSMNEGMSLWLSTVAAIAVIVVTPFTGALSDRIGRRPVLLGLCVANAVLPITLFSIMAQGSLALALVGAVALAALAGGVSAVGAVATAEQFPGEGRLTGLALGATAATAIFGGLAPLVAHLLLERTGWPSAPGLLIAAVALVVLPIMWLARETRAR